MPPAFKNVHAVDSGQSPPPSGSTSPQSVVPSLSLSFRSEQFVSLPLPPLQTPPHPAPLSLMSAPSIIPSPSLSMPSLQSPSALTSTRHWQPVPQLCRLHSASAQSISVSLSLSRPSLQLASPRVMQIAFMHTWF